MCGHTRLGPRTISVEKSNLSVQVWSHECFTLEKKMTRNVHFSRPAETDPNIYGMTMIMTMDDQLPPHVQQGGLLSLESVEKQKVDCRVVVVGVLHY